MSIIQHSKKRNYTKVKGTAYSFPHDEEERDRLTLQSNQLLKTYDSKVLHAPVELTDNDWVLDSGSGTGIWLQDLAQQTVTKPTYVGIDIEPALVPSVVSLPNNMKFEIYSVTNLPIQWTGRFTVVHQRLLINALRRQEWEKAINEIYRVLKPGGWAQLFEFRVWTAGPTLAKQLELMYRHSDAMGTMWRDIAECMPGFLQQSGFINIREDVRRTPLGSWAGQDGIDGSANLLGIMEGIKPSVLRGGGFGMVKTEADYNKLIKQAMNEVDNTPGSGIEWSMFIAQKPFYNKL